MRVAAGRGATLTHVGGAGAVGGAEAAAGRSATAPGAGAGGAAVGDAAGTVGDAATSCGPACACCALCVVAAVFVDSAPTATVLDCVTGTSSPGLFTRTETTTFVGFARVAVADVAAA
jgi:hypothetical protein